MQNLHVHTLYCDGGNTLEEMILRAIELGLEGIGFTPHSYSPWDSNHDRFFAEGKAIDFAVMPYGPDPHMWPEYREKYQQEVRLLKEKYRSQIRIFCGLEWDVATPYVQEGYDYLLGACHFLEIDGKMVSYDDGLSLVDGERVPSTKLLIDRYFDGNPLAFAKKYYDDFVRFLENHPVDVIGHFDCLANYCERYCLFNTNEKAYQSIALDALHAIAEKTKIFEVNTGALPSGNRFLPNPDPFLLKELKRLGGKVIITSDCHQKQYLNYGFSLAKEVVRACGFDTLMRLTDHGFEEEKL